MVPALYGNRGKPGPNERWLAHKAEHAVDHLGERNNLVEHLSKLVGNRKVFLSGDRE